ncbi:MAG: ABC transporter permease [Bacteroidota bacterium]
MKLSYRILMLFFIIGLCGPMLSNEQPLMLVRGHQVSFPFLQNIGYEEQAHDFIVKTIIPYSAGVSDFDNADYKSPFEHQTLKNNSSYYRHWLGTTLRGCDVLAGIIQGTRYALLVGLCSTILSLFIGLVLGASSAFLSEGALKFSWLQIFITLFFLLFLFNLITYVQVSWMIKVLCLIMACGVFLLITRIKVATSKSITIYVEKIEMQLTVLFSSLPRLFFVVAVMGLFSQGVLTLIIVLGVTGWMDISRMVRAEIKRIQEMDYYQAALMSGASWWRITIKQILPNLKPLMITVFAFSFAGAIIAESSLSFLGWGISPDEVTWGSLMMEGKESFFAWWLVVFPGICLSICLYALFSISRNQNNDIYSL